MKILKLTETTSTNDVLLAHPVPPPKEMVVAVVGPLVIPRAQLQDTGLVELLRQLQAPTCTNHFGRCS